MPKTWTFREEEGGTTAITYNADENSVSRTTGPDCDGTRSEQTLFFLPETPRGGFTALDTWYPRGRGSSEYDVFTKDPDNAAADRCISELGWALFGDKELLTSPQDTPESESEPSPQEDDYLDSLESWQTYGPDA